jgi:FkbM family methyltransferase
MKTEFFLDQSAITIKGRVEKRLRRLIFSAMRLMFKRVKRFPPPIDRLGRLTVHTPSGTRALYFRPGTSDENVIRETFNDWQYSLKRLSRWPEMLELLARCHREGRRPLIIDAGANIGASAVFFATTFPTATVIAIEPEESNFGLLLKNTRQLNVTCVKAALSGDTGQAKVLDLGEGPWAFRTQRVESGDGPPCITIGSLYDEHVDRSMFPFLVKIDIEGGEEDVFERNTAWIGDTPIVVIELHDWLLPGKGSALPFLRCVSALDRDFVYYGENVFSIDNRSLGGAAPTSTTVPASSTSG